VRILDVDPADPRIASAWMDLLRGVSEDLEREVRIREAQRKGLETFTFPWEDMRPGQGDMMEASASAVEEGSCALIEAPTGTGKTAAVLSGALPEVLARRLTLFFLTAKDTHKKIVRETLERMTAGGLPVRAIFITARERICLAGNRRCRMEDCRYAQHFGSGVRDNDLPGRLLAAGIIDPAVLLVEAASAVVCPFELSLLLSLYCDVVVCDYNYAFDPHVFLRRFFADPATAASCALLIDEAANLVPRSREYYSPGMRESTLKALKPLPKEMRSFSRLLTPWRKLFSSLERQAVDEGLPEFELPRTLELPVMEDSWRRAADKALGRIPDDLIEMMFAINDFARLRDQADSRFHLLYRREKGDAIVQWFCTDASSFLGERMGACRSTTAFSATLKPQDHFRQALGMPDWTAMLRTPYPFPRENLGVWIDARVDTRYRSRQRTLPTLVARIAGIYATSPGTYLVFFPSYEYMSMAAGPLAERGLPVMVQRPGMSPPERTEFLGRIEQKDALVLTVSGGVFAEGVDLRAPARKGAIVVGPCLPSPDLRTRLLQAGYEDDGCDGFFTAMVIPGMNRVIQAAGRLIRGPEDRGVLVLMDRRFSQEPFWPLMPEHWLRDGSMPLLGEGMTELAGFWERGGRRDPVEGAGRVPAGP